MPTIDDNFTLVKYIIKKNLNGDISPKEFNSIINTASNRELSYLIGVPEQYQVGRPVARVEIGENEIIMQKLSPFIPTPATLTIDGAGRSPFPTGHLYTVAIYDNNNNKINYVTQNYLSSYLNSTIDNIASNPIYLLEAGNFQFYPITLGVCKISYVKAPTPAKWNYTLDGNNRPVYSVTGSQDLLWSDIDQMSVIARALQMVGVNLQASQVSQFANDLIKGGQ